MNFVLPAAGRTGYTFRARQVIVSNGTSVAACLRPVLTADPAAGILRHIDAGAERAFEVAH